MATPLDERLAPLRGLISRDTIYRSVFRKAAFAGFALTAISSLIVWKFDVFTKRPVFFAILWLATLGIGNLVTLVLLAAAARKRGELFLSSSFFHAAGSALPPMLAGLGMTILAVKAGAPPHVLALLWIVFYGLMLLTTSAFAPKPVLLLGWAFLLAALLLIVLILLVVLVPIAVSEHTPFWLVIPLTFGLFHLVFALACPPTGDAE